MAAPGAFHFAGDLGDRRLSLGAKISLRRPALHRPGSREKGAEFVGGLRSLLALPIDLATALVVDPAHAVTMRG
ncbi:hypothetical protein JQ506_13020 [Shinella sp. PSBB067]|uniref:hypothetical protein n=1 Tax=Shinella sp. PSBB067 TaxID=2715959 RepID=UPI00193C6D03|nr:hypothetical protein [Shinella sp. PSBB067]QRI61830.1 hypothetical protein JQ506_13020 [Shinella sp. PSBB067]